MRGGAPSAGFLSLCCVFWGARVVTFMVPMVRSPMSVSWSEFVFTTRDNEIMALLMLVEVLYAWCKFKLWFEFCTACHVWHILGVVDIPFN